MALWLFLRALGKHWWALMSCAVFTALGVYAGLEQKSSHWFALATISAGVILFLAAAFLAWNEERQKGIRYHRPLTDEIEKRGRPEIAVDLVTFGDRRFMLRLHNSPNSLSAAVGIHIDDIRRGDLVLRFFPAPSLQPGSFDAASCRILSNGWLDADNVGALFPEDRLTKLIARKPSSELLNLCVHFNGLDSGRRQRSWLLRAMLWYDFDQKKPFLSDQTIEESSIAPASCHTHRDSD